MARILTHYLPVKHFPPQEVVLRIKLNDVLKIHTTVPGIWEIIEMTTNVVTAIYVSISNY